MAVIKNYTTTISAAKTAGEVQALLAEHGASRIAIDYADRQPAGVIFQAKDGQIFNLPVDAEAMHRTIRAEVRAGRLRGISQAQADSIEHARRVAWRVIKDWVDAQMTLVATQMASLDEVMLPYLQVEGRSLYAAYQDQQMRAIEGGR